MMLRRIFYGGCIETTKSIIFISALLLFALIAMVFYGVNQNGFGSTEIPINQLAADIEAGKVSSIKVDNNEVEIQYKSLEQKTTSISSKDRRAD